MSAANLVKITFACISSSASLYGITRISERSMVFENSVSMICIPTVASVSTPDICVMSYCIASPALRPKGRAHARRTIQIAMMTLECFMMKSAVFANMLSLVSQYDNGI